MRSTTIPTKRVAPSHSEWKPSQGQADAVRFLTSTDSAALWADPGAGKTSITLAAFTDLLWRHEEWKGRGSKPKMLVVAPLRVCQLVWRQEAQKWTQFRHLKIVLLHGPNKDAALKEDADIYLINYEGLDWLCDKYYGRQLPFDIVCCDELTKLKNHQSKRAKKLRNCTKRTPYKWGLTGTPVPNGYMDLFGQFLWLDPNILGAYITHFRDQYFKIGFTGFDYTLQAGAAERIEKRIENNVFRLEYSAMPARDVPIMIEFDKKSLAAYRAMKKDMLLELPDGVVTAANAAAVQQKLEQMANGAVYLRPGEPEWAHIHDLKLDALEELIEEMNGQQILIAYQFEHDLVRIQKRFPDIPVLRGSEKQVQQFEDDWNAGKIQAMLVHPASVGHGLNLQKSSARHICWFSATFNLEHWDQLIRRLRRQGSNAKDIMNHILVVKGTVDELKLEVLSDKDSGQARLLQGFARILSEDTSVGADPRRARDSVPERGEAIRGRSSAGAYGAETGEVPAGDDGRGESYAAEPDSLLREHPQSSGPDSDPSTHDGGAARLEPTQTNPGEDTVNTGFRRLSRQEDQQPAAEAERPAPKGWPSRTAPQPAAQPAADNREEIRNRVTRAPAQQEQAEDTPPPVSGRAGFSQGIQRQLAGEQAQEAQPEPAQEVPVDAKPAPRPRAARAVKTESDDTATAKISAVGAAHIEVRIFGDPAAVKDAMRAFLNA